MAANDFLYAREPSFTGEVPTINLTGSDIAQGVVVKLDTSNPISGTVFQPGITPAGANDIPFGVTLEKIVNGRTGRVAIAGIAQCVASGAITVGNFVQCAASGQVSTQGTAHPTLGTALTAAAGANDRILVRISVGFNA